MEFPVEATITELNLEYGNGVATTADGVKFRFTHHACKDFRPGEGTKCFVIVGYGPTPDEPEVRYAAILSTSANYFAEEQARITERHRLAAERAEKESQLLSRFGLPSIQEVTRQVLLSRSGEERVELARALMELKRQEHLFDELFTRLVEADPAAFHPFLGELDWGDEPESLAFIGAPAEAVERFIPVLERADEVPQVARLPVGYEADELEANRACRSAGNDAGAAMMALARSGGAAARQALARWAQGASADAREEANWLLNVCGMWLSPEGQLEPLFSREGWTLEPTPEATGHTMWHQAQGECAACKSPLLEVARIAVEEGTALRQLVQVAQLRIVTCRRCIRHSLSPLFFAFAGDGTVTHLFRELEDDFEPPPPPKKPLAAAPTNVKLRPGALVMSYYQRDPEAMNRVGGLPTWVQTPRPVPCPKCARPMRFVAQFDDPPGDIWTGSPGVLLAFFCPADRVGATTTQSM